MGSWVTRSRPSLQLATAVGCFVVGLVLVIGFRGFNSVKEDAFAGFLLGVMLAVVGLLALVFTGAQTVTVDPGARRIDVVEMSVVGRRSRSIRFDAVRSIDVGFLGKRSNFVRKLLSGAAPARRQGLSALRARPVLERRVRQGYVGKLAAAAGGIPRRSPRGRFPGRSGFWRRLRLLVDPLISSGRAHGNGWMLRFCSGQPKVSLPASGKGAAAIGPLRGSRSGWRPLRASSSDAVASVSSAADAG